MCIGDLLFRGSPVKTCWLLNESQLCHQLFCQQSFLFTRFRPGRRACCLARPEGRNLSFGSFRRAKPLCGAKGPKPIDATSGLIRGDERQLEEGGPTRFAQTMPANSLERPSLGQTAGVGSWETNIWVPPMKEMGTICSV